ncbi:MAG: RNA polymerase sigma factor, partial [Gammaproteobacteria bacterium]
PTLHTLSRMREEASDESLMQEYRSGDVGAFEILYSRHKGNLFRYLLRQCGNAAIAEELFQDVWMKLIGAREHYEVRARFTTWLYQMARNHYIDYYRRHKITGALDATAGDCDPEEVPVSSREQPEHLAEVREQTDILMQLVDQLPEDQREAFVLREEGGLSVEEIAAVTGVKPETAKSRLRYAVNKLRAGLTKK